MYQPFRSYPIKGLEIRFRVYNGPCFTEDQLPFICVVDTWVNRVEHYLLYNLG